MQRAPHRWNTGFRLADHDGPRTSITLEQERAFDRDGFFVVEEAFDASTLAQLDAELAGGDEHVKKLLAGAPGGRFSVAGLDTQTVAPHAVTRSPFVREFVAHEVLARLARDFARPTSCSTHPRARSHCTVARTQGLRRALSRSATTIGASGLCARAWRRKSRRRGRARGTFETRG